jgi:hypothetical protein
MNFFVFIADVFADEIAGGGELNNEEVIKILNQNGNLVHKLKSNQVTVNLLENYKNYSAKFIIGNFIGLGEAEKLYLQNNCEYIIYEHDHKYVKSRNPAQYPNYKAPESEIVNYSFYKKAQVVICQSKLHKSIIERNINLNNVVSVGGNLWSDESLQIIEEMSKVNKSEYFAIMDSNNWHKNTQEAVEFCKKNNYPYTLISDPNYHNFLRQLGSHKVLVFLPKTPETLSRIAVEALMMNVNVATNMNLGAASEEWFNSKRGIELISLMKEKREFILDIFMKAFNR